MKTTMKTTTTIRPQLKKPLKTKLSMLRARLNAMRAKLSVLGLMQKRNTKTLE